MPKRGADPDDFPFDDRPADRPVEGDLVVGHSELHEFRHCPLKWYFSYAQGWHKPHEDADYVSPTSKGTHWHLVMEACYRSLLAKPGDWDAAMNAAWDKAEELIEKIKDWETTHSPKKGEEPWSEILDFMLTGYGDNYSWHADRFKVTFVEHTRWCRLPQPDGSPSDVVLRYTPDLVIFDRELEVTGCVDHKSTGTSLGQVNVDLNDQFGLYPWALTRTMGKPVTHFWCSQAHTKKLKRHMVDSERFKWLPTHRSVREQHQVAIDAWRTADALRHVRATGGPPYSAPDQMQCRRMCQFEEAHIMIRRDARQNAENLVLSGLGFEQGGNQYQRDMREKDAARLEGI